MSKHSKAILVAARVNTEDYFTDEEIVEIKRTMAEAIEKAREVCSRRVTRINPRILEARALAGNI